MAGHRYCLCPFFQRTCKDAILCENKTRLNFKDAKGASDYYKNYCCGEWKTCSVAKALNDYYERNGNE